MEANQAPLEKAMAKKSLVEARKVLGEVCTTKPSPFDSKYDGYGYAHVQTNAECVNDVLVCGEDEALAVEANAEAPPLKTAREIEPTPSSPICPDTAAQPGRGDSRIAPVADATTKI